MQVNPNAIRPRVAVGFTMAGGVTAFLGGIATAILLPKVIGTVLAILLTCALAVCAVLLFAWAATSLRASRTNAQADSDPDDANPAKTHKANTLSISQSASSEKNSSLDSANTSSSNLSLVNTNPKLVVEEQDKIEEKEEEASPSPSSSPSDENLGNSSQTTDRARIVGPAASRIQSSSNATNSVISSLHPIPTEGNSSNESQINEPQVIETAVGNVTNEDALNLIHSVLGNDFDKFNNGVKFIDFSTAGDPPNAMPHALVDFCYACHPEAKAVQMCAGSSNADPMNLPSDSTQSMYVRQSVEVPRVVQESPYGKLLPFISTIWNDASCIVPRPGNVEDGRSGYYVCSNPDFIGWEWDDSLRPTAANFCQAFAREMKNHPALIVDVSEQGEDYNYIQSWIEHAGKKRMPAAGVVDNVCSIPMEDVSGVYSTTPYFKHFTISLQRFQLHETDTDGEKIDNISYRLTVNGWKDSANIASKDMQWLIDTIHAIVKKYGILAKVIHCSSGCGRAPTLALRSMVADVARKAKEQGIPCCFANNGDEQLQPCVNGHLNLAYVLRNAALSLVSSRGVAGWGKDQYQGDLEYAQFLAAQ
ncbi:MAG: hypothetical protein LBP65_03665 [Puniceicoccales bacterium]|jgi:hypothetical protein|nr:hypothetical protein [Puniceicoccales bacterium]